MPEEVVDVFGYALYLAQTGRKHPQAKPLKGFGSAGVLEVVEDDEAALTERYILLSSATAFMCCIVSRRNRKRALKPQSRIRT